MADLIAVTFEDETKAFGLRAALGKLQDEHQIDMEDVAVVTRDNTGNLKLHQATSLTAAGALGGTFWGLLIGIIFLEPVLGAAIGAGAGALSGRLADHGIEDGFIETLGKGLANGGSALIFLLRKSTPDKVLAALEPFRGRGNVLQTLLSSEHEQRLREFLRTGTA